MSTCSNFPVTSLRQRHPSHRLLRLCSMSRLITSTATQVASMNTRRRKRGSFAAHSIALRRWATSVGRVAAPGSHNLVNACFAAALARLAGLANDAIVDGLSSFTGLPHRTQCVRQVHGVRFINDSKGTNVGATCTALEGMTAPTVLIAGGVGKDQDFQPLATALRQKGRALIVFGRDAERIASAVNRAVPTHTVGHLDEAVSLAQSLAQPGDTVLFSPACSSFDMFRNFEERGNAFVETVEALSA